jgi:hypothetical protein
MTKRATLALMFTVGLASTCATAQTQFNDRLPTNCAGLGVMVKADIDRMRRLQERAKKEEKAPPADLVSAWQRTFGKKGDGVPSLSELKKIRQHADGLNATLQARGCPTIDIDQALTIVQQGPASKDR